MLWIDSLGRYLRPLVHVTIIHWEPLPSTYLTLPTLVNFVMRFSYLGLDPYYPSNL